MPAQNEAGLEFYVRGAARSLRDLQNLNNSMSRMSSTMRDATVQAGRFDRDLANAFQRTRSNVTRVRGAQQDFSDSIDASATAAGAFGIQVDALSTRLVALGASMTAVGAAGIALARSLTETAARTEELDILMRSVAQTTGNSVTDVVALRDAMREQNITTQASSKAMIQFMRYGFDMAKVTKLAAVAQDAATYAAQDSSEAFEGLINAIVKYDSRLLRTYGITTNLRREFRDYAEQVGKNAEELTALEKQTVALNVVLEQGEQIAGLYEASMTTMAKQQRQLKRHLEETANQLGEHLIPVMKGVIQAVTGVLKWFQELPDATQATIVQTGVFVSGLLALGGALTALIPVINLASGALAALGIASATALGPIGLLIAGLVGIGVAIQHLKNLQKAREKEAASILEASKSYKEYISNLREADLIAYEVSEAFYEVEKAALAAAAAMSHEQFVETFESLKTYFQSGGFMDLMRTEFDRFGTEADNTASLIETAFIPTIKNLIPGMSALELHTLLAENEIAALLISMGATIPVAKTLASEASRLADSELQLRDATANVDAGIASIWEQTKAYIENTPWDKVFDALKEAVSEAIDTYEDFYTSLSSGIINFRDLRDESRQTRKEFKLGLKELAADASASIDKITQKYDKMFPDASSVEERMGMVGDAWDEFALRAEDIVQLGEESPWVGQLTEELARVGQFKPDNAGLREWFREMKAMFLRGELPELINTSAYGWELHQERVKKAQEAETAAIRAEQAKQAQILKEKRDRELAEQQAARERTLLETALGLAKTQGDLDEWASQMFGTMAPAFDSVGEVMAALESGMLEIDPLLGDIITTYETGLLGALNTTGDAAEANKQKMADFLQTSKAEAAALTKDLQISPSDIVPRSLGPKAGTGGEDYLSKESIAVIEDMNKRTEAMFGPSGPIKTGMTWFGDQLNEVSDSLVPEVREKFDELGVQLLGMTDSFTYAVNAELAPAFEGVLNILREFPTRIEIEFDYVEAEEEEEPPPPGKQHGGPVRAGFPYVVGEAGKELFIPNVSGVVLPNQITHRVLSPVGGSGVNTSIGGDTVIMNITDPLSMALARDMVESRRRERRNAFMGVQ